MMHADNLSLHLNPVHVRQVKSLRILTLNLFLRPPLVKNNESDHKEARTAYFCENVLDDYDIVCLQEVFSTFNTRRSQIISAAQKKGFPYSCHSPSPGFFRAQAIDGGLLILSRYPIVESDFCGFGNGLFPDVFSFKGVLQAKIQAGHKDLQVFTLHAQATYPGNDPDITELYVQARKEQIAHTVKFIRKKTEGTQDPIVLVGDFNINAKSEEYLDLVSSLEDLDLSDLLRVKYEESPSTYGIKLVNGEPEETVLSHRNECLNDTAIDYIFLSNSGGVTPLMEFTHTCPFYTTGEPFTRISDHYGVQTVLSL